MAYRVTALFSPDKEKTGPYGLIDTRSATPLLYIGTEAECEKQMMLVIAKKAKSRWWEWWK